MQSCHLFFNLILMSGPHPQIAAGIALRSLPPYLPPYGTDRRAIPAAFCFPPSHSQRSGIALRSLPPYLPPHCTDRNAIPERRPQTLYLPPFPPLANCRGTLTARPPTSPPTGGR